MEGVAFKWGPSESLRKLISLELTNREPWLERFASEPEERRRLKLNCQDKSHSLLVQILNRLLMLGSLQWTSPQDELTSAAKRWPKHINTLKVSLKGGIRSQGYQVASYKWPDQERRWLAGWHALVFATVFCAMLYTTLSINAAAYIQFQHDAMLSKLRPTVAERQEAVEGDWRRGRLADLMVSTNTGGIANQSAPSGVWVSPDGQCAIKWLINNGPGFNELEFIGWSERLAEAGVFVRAQVGTIFMSMTIVSTTPYIFYLFPRAIDLVEGGAVRVDSVTALLKPLKERRRLLRSLQAITDNMISAFKSAFSENEFTHRRGSFGKGPLILNSLRVAGSLRSPSALNSSSLTRRQWQANALFHQDQNRLARRSLDHPDNREFLAILHTIRRDPSGHVRPIVVNSECHYLKQRAVPVILIIFVWLGFGFAMTCTAVAWLLELEVRVRDKLRALDCARWHPDGVLLRPNLYLEPMEAHEQETFAAYDGSRSYFVYLMLVVEMKHSIYLEGGGFMFKWICLNFFLTAWAAMWGLVCILSILDMLNWLVQLRNQISWCGRESRALRLMYAQPQLVSGNSEQRQRRHQLLTRLTAVFLHFQLYRDQYRPFQRRSNINLAQISILTLLTFGALYLESTNIETRYKLFSTFVSSAIIITINFFLILSSLLPTQMERIMHDAVDLLSQLAHEPKLIVLPTLDIWRRQLLSEQELHSFSSLRVFGVQVTHRNIMTFNVQLLAIWLLLWNVVGVAPSSWRPTSTGG